MAPNLKTVETQTFEVLTCLFDDSETSDRTACIAYQNDIETDGPDPDPDFDPDFDPVLIADKLRHVADALNANVQFQAQLKELKQTAVQEALDQTLSRTIDTLVQTQVVQTEGAPELQLIKATLAVGLYMKKTCPDLRDRLQNSIGNFLNQRVACWVQQQGGWASVASVTQV